jgi:hypothetical protein
VQLLARFGDQLLTLFGIDLVVFDAVTAAVNTVLPLHGTHGARRSSGRIGQ